MNILFVTDYNVFPLNGGIERFVYKLSERLSLESNIQTFLAYVEDVEQNGATHFKEKIKIDKENSNNEISNFILKHQINIIHVDLIKKNNIKFLMPILYEERLKRDNLKLLFLYHNMPGYEMVPMNMEVHLYRIFRSSQKIYSLKDFFMQIFARSFGRVFQKSFFSKKYNRIFRNVDKIVLLSNSYIKDFAQIAGTTDLNKFHAISNPLSFDYFADNNTILKKQKQVLIVSRLEEKQKRIYLALRIWQKIEEIYDDLDWTLKIVGDGEDVYFCKKKASQLGLKHISFEGRKKSEPYYTDSAIFMMTSAFEGFPMTLGEASQMGTVPIAFDSFGAIHDIIEDGHNGCIIKNNDISSYVEKLLFLMQNESKRIEMAQNAVECSKKFHSSIIMKQWIYFFNDLLMK